MIQPKDSVVPPAPFSIHSGYSPADSVRVLSEIMALGSPRLVKRGTWYTASAGPFSEKDQREMRAWVSLADELCIEAVRRLKRASPVVKSLWNSYWNMHYTVMLQENSAKESERFLAQELSLLSPNKKAVARHRADSEEYRQRARDYAAEASEARKRFIAGVGGDESLFALAWAVSGLSAQARF